MSYGLPRNVGARSVNLDEPQVYHFSNWGQMSDPDRVGALRTIVKGSARDPRIRTLVFRILQEAGTDQRKFQDQASVLLHWVQEHIHYLNEPGEILQDPLYTLGVGAGDCDDMALLLATFYEAIRLEWRFVLAGSDPRTKARARWTEGEPFPRGVRWEHIYLKVGWPPFRPSRWTWAEPTVRGKPLGWDFQGHLEATGQVPPLPELAGVPSTGAASTASGIAAAGGYFENWDWEKIAMSVVIGVVTSVASQAILAAIQKKR